MEGIPRLSFLLPRGFFTHQLAYMLDSLVRVSRRVGWKAPSASIQRVQVPAKARRRTAHPFGPGNGTSISQKLRRERPALILPPLPTLASDPSCSGRPASRPTTTGTHTRHPFASLPAISSTFNSLFKVLFIFPSRYLFAIGLLPVFSLR